MAWHEIFPTHKHAKLHYLATLFDNIIVLSNPEQSHQIVHRVFCQTFTKSCQITKHVLQIILPKHCQLSANLFSLNDLF